MLTGEQENRLTLNIDLFVLYIDDHYQSPSIVMRVSVSSPREETYLSSHSQKNLIALHELCSTGEDPISVYVRIFPY